MGKYKRTAIGTLVERTTRYTLLVPLGKNKSATDVRRAYQKAMKTIPKELAKTLTYDQGKEMSEHKRFTIDTGIQVSFAHPGSPWERGTNENTNGLIPVNTFQKALSLTKYLHERSNAYNASSMTVHERP